MRPSFPAMLAAVTFEFPLAWQVGVPVMLLLLGGVLWSWRRRGLARTRWGTLGLLRGSALLLLLLLAARPVWVRRDPAPAHTPSVLLLLDRSESMSLEEGSSTRYEQVLDFTREKLLPGLRSVQLSARAFLFAQGCDTANGPKLAATRPDGKRTNLGGAVAQALGTEANPPLAVIACTDGALNENSDNARALAALTAARVPLFAVGFGSDFGARTLSLRNVEAPPRVSPNTSFHISAQFEMVSQEEVPPFELALFRDGQLHESKTIRPGQGSRSWLESFRVNESQMGLHRYSVQFLPPSAPGLKCVNTMGTATVRVTNERELRVLYVQGALTWDYKFVVLALQGDPSIKLTGLTRTSERSVFRQNVESAGELLHGFPTTQEEMARYRVIVLSNLSPIDLSPDQQELLARYCGELGGGLLMIGGPGTFDFSWKDTRLEQFMPVVFSRNQGVRGLDRPFRLILTDDALQHPVFRVDDQRPVAEIWASLPAFTQYGRVDALKPGAHVWGRHQEDEGPDGKRILMAWQRYGAGISAVVCLQNFWRWRLAKDASPQHFDRFWRQLFRFISESSREDISIHLADQNLQPESEILLSLERQPSPSNLFETNYAFSVQVELEPGQSVRQAQVELKPGQPVDFSFRAAQPGLYLISLQNNLKQTVASRTVEIRDINLEFQNTSRNMEILRQWASLTGGLAVKAEECSDPSDLIAKVQARAEQARRDNPLIQPLGINAWIFSLLLALLGAEWILRKRWDLV